MITVNFDALNANVFTLVERTIEVNFGGATYEGGGEPGSPTTAAVIPSVAADISAYNEVTFDAFQDYGGFENANGQYEIDVDLAAYQDDTIIVLSDSDWSLSLYKLTNVQINKVYYFKIASNYSFEDNPTILDTYFSMNGFVGSDPLGVKLAYAIDYNVNDGTILCFILSEAPSDLTLNDVLLFSYYKDDFRMLPRKNAPGFTFSNLGRELLPLFEPTDNIMTITNNKFQAKTSNIKLKDIPFSTLSNKREDYISVADEEDWLLSALGYKVSPNQDYTSGTDLLPVQGNQSYTLPNSTLTLIVRPDNKVGWKGVLIITPGGNSIALAAGYIPMPGSEAFNSGSSKVIIKWEAISNTEVIYTLKNIA